MLANTARHVARIGGRKLHTTRVVRGSHGGDPTYDYLHAKHMYMLREKPLNKPLSAVLIFGGVATGIGIPVFAINLQQKKAGLK